VKRSSQKSAQRDDLAVYDPHAVIVSDRYLSVHDGHLFIEHCDTVELAERFGTPLFLVSESQLRGRFREFKEAFQSAWPEGSVNILPSIKANYCFALRRILSEEGAGCDTFGEGELQAALACGVAPELISVNGSTKSAALLRRSVEVGARITLDSVAELQVVEEAARELGRRAAIRFRVRPRYDRLDAISQLSFEPVTIRDAAQRYKPGLPIADLLAVVPQAASSPNLDFRGLHYHIGRHSSGVDMWRLAIDSFADVVAEVSRVLGGWLPEEIDVGGGFAPYRDPVARAWHAVPQTPSDAIPSVREYAEAVAEALRSAFQERGLAVKGATLEVEPGRSLYANAGIHLTRVQNFKQQDEPQRWRWVEVDTSEIFLSDVWIEGWRWCVIVANKADEPCPLVADVVGKSCGFDLLVPDAQVPTDVGPGDVLAFLDTGAYDEAYSSNFNAMCRPATVLILGDSADVVKRAETYEDVFAREIIPERLRSGSPVKSNPTWR